MKNNIVGLKEFRNKTENYISQIRGGKSFIVVKRSRPVFKISPVSDDLEVWEPVIDFTKIKKGGVLISELLSRL